MSVSTPSDSPVAEQGSVGQGSPGVPELEPQGMPTDGAFAATEDQPGDASLPEDAAEGVVFSEEDLAWLQSDEVRQALAQNSIPGIYTEQQFQEHKAQLQKTLREQENARISELQRQSRSELETAQATAKAQAAALVSELYRAWQDNGLEEGSPEWNQRMQAVLQATQTYIDRDVADRTRQSTARQNLVTTEAQKTYDDLRAFGVELPQGHEGHGIVRQYLTAIREGQVAEDQLEASRRNVIRYIMGMNQNQNPQAQAQQQPAGQGQAQPAQQPATSQQPRQQRPNPGPMRSARGGGGAPRSFEEIFDAGEQKLIQQYGDATKVPQSKWDELHIEASMQAAR